MAKSSVCLATICKTESKIITRMLDSVVDYIDHWLIIDTGSTDGTQDIIRTYFAALDIPGELLEEPWVDFAYNRTSLVTQAREKGCDYLLLMDADCVLTARRGDFDTLTADSYMIHLPGDDLSYDMPYLVSSGIRWRYISPTHEYLTSDDSFITETHPTLSILHIGDGGTKHEKFDRDRSILEREYAKDPDNQRTVFYLGNTYRDMGDRDAALHMFQRRAEMGGWDEEVYCALLYAARLTDSTDDLLRAHCHRPSRPEAVHRLIQKHNELGQYQVANLFAQLAPSTPSQDALFVENWTYEYGIDFETAISEWYVGSKDLAKWKFLHLLDGELPDAYRASVTNNLKFCE